MANFLSSFFDPGEAWDRARKAEQEGYEKSQGYQQPYWQQGLDQYGRLNTATDKLMDPAALQNEWSKNYETSPYAQQLLKQNQASGLDTASAMGLNGSSAALGNIQQGAGNIVSQDRQQYMNDLMQKYMAGIGLGQNIYGIGAQAGANLGNQAMTHGENQTQLQYGRYNAPGQLFGQLAGGALNMFGGGDMLKNLFNNSNNMPAYARNALYG